MTAFLLYDDLVALAERIEREAGIATITAVDLDRWQRALCREERRGVTPGGIEWRG